MRVFHQTPLSMLEQTLERQSNDPERYFLYAFAHLLRDDEQYRKLITKYIDKFKVRYLDNGGYVGEPLPIDELVAMREDFGFDYVAVPDWPFKVGETFRAALRALDKYDPKHLAVYVHALSATDINVWIRLLEDKVPGCISVPAHAPLCEMCELCQARLMVRTMCTRRQQIVCAEFGRRIVMSRLQQAGIRTVYHSAGIRYVPIFAMHPVKIDLVDTTAAYKYARHDVSFLEVLPREAGKIFGGDSIDYGNFWQYANSLEQILGCYP